MRTIPLLLFCLGIQFAQAQQHTTEINEQVWKPFIQAFEKNDITLFKSLHSPLLTRVQPDKLLGYEAYMANYQQTFVNMTQKNVHFTISFRFTRRQSDGTRAYEEGFYRTTTSPGENGKAFYGRFTVLLTKEAGRWKILMDSDTGEGMSEAVFLTGKPLE